MDRAEAINALKEQIDALVTYGNGVTGGTDTRIGDVVRTLAEGYGQGGGGGGALENIPDVADPSKSMAYMLSAIKNGTAKSGTKTWTEAFPNTEALALETGLDEIHGIMLNMVDSTLVGAINSVQNNRFVVISVNEDQTLTAFGITTGNPAGGAPMHNIQPQGVVVQSAPFNGSVRFEGGNMYCAGRYNKNGNYQMVALNVEYEWIAW